MSISVHELSRWYGTQKAVNSISFEANKGEILGFLGPNGAGKTTTMKMLTCFLPPTAGSASVCGHDIRENPMQIRKCIGYLPEHNPLYPDMYIKESLQFTAQLHQLGKNSTQRIEEMIELTGLQREQHKQIGQLSKGYRQRVGLAQAMIHNPDVLILDEPTSGLDPNQIAEIRQVIKQLGEEKTVILSTHIMQEVQALCDRVIIINKGNIVANDTTAAIQQYATEQTNIIVEFAEKVNLELLQQIPGEGIDRMEAFGSNQWHIFVSGSQDIRANIFNFAVQNNLTLLTLQQEKSNLEDVFRLLTQTEPSKS